MSVHEGSTGPGVGFPPADEYAALVARVDEAMAQAQQAVDRAGRVADEVSAVRGRGFARGVRVTVGPSGHLVAVDFGDRGRRASGAELAAATMEANALACRDAEQRVSLLMPPCAADLPDLRGGVR